MNICSFYEFENYYNSSQNRFVVVWSIINNNPPHCHWTTSCKARMAMVKCHFPFKFQKVQNEIKNKNIFLLQENYKSNLDFECNKRFFMLLGQNIFQFS